MPHRPEPRGVDRLVTALASAVAGEPTTDDGLTATRQPGDADDELDVD